MNSGKKIASLLAGGALTIAAVPLAGTALASEAVPDGQSGTNVPAADASAESHVARALDARQVIQHVQGVFAWNQDAIGRQRHPRQGPVPKPRLPVRSPGRRRCLPWQPKWESPPPSTSSK